MSVPYPYRVKGIGSARQIFYGDVLVGTLDQREHGWWYGVRPDGSPVLREYGDPVRTLTIARWRTPNLWRTP